MACPDYNQWPVLIIIMSRLHNAEQSGWNHDFNHGNILIRNHTPDCNQGAVLILIMLRDVINFQHDLNWETA